MSTENQSTYYGMYIHRDQKLYHNRANHFHSTLCRYPINFLMTFYCFLRHCSDYLLVVKQCSTDCLMIFDSCIASLYHLCYDLLTAIYRLYNFVSLLYFSFFLFSLFYGMINDCLSFRLPFYNAFISFCCVKVL